MKVILFTVVAAALAAASPVPAAQREDAISRIKEGRQRSDDAVRNALAINGANFDALLSKRQEGNDGKDAGSRIREGRQRNDDAVNNVLAFHKGLADASFGNA